MPHAITAEVELQDAKAQWRDHRPGRLLRRLEPVHEGRPGAPRVQLVRPGAHQHRARRGSCPGQAHHPLRVHPRQPKPGTGGKSILSVDGKKVAESKIPKTQPFVFSGDEGIDVGIDAETNVSPDYKQRNNTFTGKILKVTVEQK